MLQTTTYKETPDFFGVDYTKKGIATKVRINYTTFGAIMPGRNVTSSNPYLYGNNGMENDKELSTGAQNFDAREYDNRLGRFFSTDPHWHRYPWISPYVALNDNPILYIDRDGRDNILYVVFRPGVSSVLKKEDVTAAIAKAQIEMDYIMGGKGIVKVQEFNENVNGTFDITNIDPTDAVVVISDPTTILEEAKKVLCEVDYNYFSDQFVSGSPENSCGQIIGINEKEIPGFHSAINWFEKDFLSTTLALTMLHGTVHSAAGGGHPNVTKKFFPINDITLFSNGNSMVNSSQSPDNKSIKSSGDILFNKNNKQLKDFIRERFSSKSAHDNYFFNKNGFKNQVRINYFGDGSNVGKSSNSSKVTSYQNPRYLD